ncbi:MAG: hypothetical protein PF549_01535, partial [Patescibacteria group bacterium]|nr:hypothetical protein [Patescibacteria group bacterium]
MIWALYFLESFIAGLLVGLFLLWIKKSFKKNFIGRWGGLIVIIPTFLIILINPEIKLTYQITGILIGALAVLFFGLWDDYKKVSWKCQLTFQFLLAFGLVW